MIIPLSAFICLLFPAVVLLWVQKWALSAPHQELNRGEAPSHWMGLIRYPLGWAAGSIACTLAYITSLWVSGLYSPHSFRTIAVLATISAAISLAIATIWVKWFDADISFNALIRVHYTVLSIMGVISLVILVAIGLGNIK